MTKFLAAVVGAFVVIALFASAGDFAKTAEVQGAIGAVDPAPAERVVSYEILGSAPGVDLTYTDASGSIVQQSRIRVPIPSEKMRFRSRPGEFVQISAQNVADYGSVTCVIRVDGEVVETATSSGAYVIAGCQATVP